MGDPPSNQATKPPLPIVWVGWVLPILFIIATRLLTFGVGEPWVDELTNWQLAREHALTLPTDRAHSLTYFLISLGLAISDSTWGLRMSAAVLGALTMLILFRWSWSRFTPGFAWMALLLLGFSPIAIYYAQDANHYTNAILAGFLAVIAFTTFLERGWRASVTYFGLIGAIMLLVLSHPLIVFPLIAAASAPFVRAFLVADDLVPGNAPLVRKRLLVLLVSVAIMGFALNLLLFKFESVRGFPPPVGRQFGLNADFVGAMLASFYAGLFVYSPLDIAMGVIGFILTLLGWATMVRREETRWAGVGCIAVVLATVMPYTMVSLGQSFSPRYLSPVLVPLLVGLAGALVWRPAVGGRAVPLVHVVMVGLIVVYTGRSIAWNAHRLSGNFQQSFTSMKWIAENTPDDSVLLTRHMYISVSTRVAWNRHDMGMRHHVALAHDSRSATVSIQQIEEHLHESGRPHYLYYIEGLERMGRDFLPYAWQHAEEVAHLPSWSQDPFNTIVRNITISRVGQPPESPFALPRSGASASAVFPERIVTSRGTREEGHLLLSGVSGAMYRLDIEKPAPGLRVSIAVGEDSPPPRYVALLLNGSHAFLHEVDDTPGSQIMDLDVELEAGRHELVIALPAHRFGGAGRQQLEVHRIDTIANDSPMENRARPLHHHGDFGDTIHLADNDLEFSREHRLLQELPIELEADGGDDLIVLWQRQEVGGIGDLGLRTRLHPEDGRPLNLGAFFSWLYNGGWRVAVLTSGEAGDVMHLETRLGPAYNFFPRDKWLKIHPATIYTDRP